MNKQEIVWIFGQSAAGKATFINAVTQESAIQQSLGWSAKTIASCQASLLYIGQSFDDSIREKRKYILDEVSRLSQDHDVVLIKWQHEDSTTHRIVTLQQLLPNAHHRIILLSLTREENAARLHTKPWWSHNWDTNAFIDDEIKDINTFLDATDLPVAVISSTSNENYTVIEGRSRLS